MLYIALKRWKKEYIHIVYDYVTDIENAHIISKQTFTLLKLYHKILKEKAEKRRRKGLKTSFLSLLVSLLLSSSCRSGFQKVLSKASKGR